MSCQNFSTNKIFNHPGVVGFNCELLQKELVENSELWTEEFDFANDNTNNKIWACLQKMGVQTGIGFVCHNLDLFIQQYYSSNPPLSDKELLHIARLFSLKAQKKDVSFIWHLYQNSHSLGVGKVLLYALFQLLPAEEMDFYFQKAFFPETTPEELLYLLIDFAFEEKNDFLIQRAFSLLSTAKNKSLLEYVIDKASRKGIILNPEIIRKLNSKKSLGYICQNQLFLAGDSKAIENVLRQVNGLAPNQNLSWEISRKIELLFQTAPEEELTEIPAHVITKYLSESYSTSKGFAFLLKKIKEPNFAPLFQKVQQHFLETFFTSNAYESINSKIQELIFDAPQKDETLELINQQIDSFQKRIDYAQKQGVKVIEDDCKMVFLRYLRYDFIRQNFPEQDDPHQRMELGRGLSSVLNILNAPRLNGGYITKMGTIAAAQMLFQSIGISPTATDYYKKILIHQHISPPTFPCFMSWLTTAQDLRITAFAPSIKNDVFDRPEGKLLLSQIITEIPPATNFLFEKIKQNAFDQDNFRKFLNQYVALSEEVKKMLSVDNKEIMNRQIFKHLQTNFDEYKLLGLHCLSQNGEKKDYLALTALLDFPPRKLTPAEQRNILITLSTMKEKIKKETPKF